MLIEADTGREHLVPGKGVDQKEGTSLRRGRVTQRLLGTHMHVCVNSMSNDSQKLPLGPRSVAQLL